jgi:hypothetical protein
MSCPTKNCPFCGTERKDDKSKTLIIGGENFGNKLFWHFYSPECVKSHFTKGYHNGDHAGNGIHPDFRKVCEYVKEFYTRTFAKNEAHGRKTDIQEKFESSNAFRFAREMKMATSGEEAVETIYGMVQAEAESGSPKPKKRATKAKKVSESESESESGSETEVRVPKKVLGEKKKAKGFGKPYGSTQTREMATQYCEEDTLTTEELGERWEQLYGENTTEEIRQAFKPRNFDIIQHLLTKQEQEPATPTIHFGEEDIQFGEEIEEPVAPIVIKRKKGKKQLKIVSEEEESD